MNLKVAISTFNNINPDELWLTFETESNLGIIISIHEVVANMDPRICATYFPNVSYIYSM